MNRPDKDHYYLDIAQAVAKRSTCLRRQYGASRAAVATNATFTKQAKTLAKRCGVELWERY